MKAKLITSVLAAVCGWLLIVTTTHAQLAREWSYSLSSLGGMTDKPPIVDDSGNVFVLSWPSTPLTGARVSKIRTDSTLAWQSQFLYGGVYQDYFGVGPDGSAFVLMHSEIDGVRLAVIAVKFDPDGNLAWERMFGPINAPMFISEPKGAVDINGNLWVGANEYPVDSCCIDSMDNGSGEPGRSLVRGQGVLYRLNGMTGDLTEIQRFDGGAQVPYYVMGLRADHEGYINAWVRNVEFCCDEQCQNCRDSCFDVVPPSIVWSHALERTTDWLYRYTTAGGGAGASRLAASDDSHWETNLASGFTGGVFTYTKVYDSVTASSNTEWSSVGHWTTLLLGSVLPRANCVTDYRGNVLLWQSVGDDGDPNSYAQWCYLDGATGSVLWTKRDMWGTAGFDRDGNVLVQVGYTIHKLDEGGDELWTYTMPVSTYSFLYCDTAGFLYYRDAIGVSKYRPFKYLTIRDGHGDTIPEVTFDLIQVKNNPPYFDEDTLGSFTTDSLGRLAMTPYASDSFLVELDLDSDTIAVGDSLKIAKHVYSRPAVKHEGVLGTLYSLYLDNARFAEDGHMYFDTLTSDDQEVVLNHTEFRYNLLVSVQWEATEDYLISLQDNLRMMSNYFYDVTDGQICLDTVYIFDHDDFSIEADLWILASNMQRPEAEVFGAQYNHADPSSGMSVSHVVLPRIWMGDSTSTRNHTDAVYPLDLVTPSKDYRAKVHELGHYALGFYDEYLLWHPDSNLYSSNPVLRCLPIDIFRYGFMDSPYESEGTMTSEMSNAFRYNMESCRNTNQYRVNLASCWDFWESRVEDSLWGEDSLYVPILKPDALDSLERIVSNPAQYFAGPNDDLSRPDYDVGSRMKFPNPPSAQAAGYADKHIRVYHSLGGDNADVVLQNDLASGTGIEIAQGRTSDAAGAWVVGVNEASSRILASKKNSYGTVTQGAALASPHAVSGGWLCGTAESIGSEDSLTIQLHEVQGNYPVIFSTELLASGITYTALIGQPFPTDPTVELWPSHAGYHEYAPTLSADRYSITVLDTIGIFGTFTLWAADDSASSFFAPSAYTRTVPDHNRPVIWLFGPESQAEFRLDSANVSLTDAMILSSSYPVIRTGLDPNAVQAGQAHCLSVYPDAALTGSNQVVIRYEDADLMLGETALGNEATLAVYHWVDGSGEWQPVGGVVDTAANAVYAEIAAAGVYAAFTSDIVLGIDDTDPEVPLPYNFELAQNYPNPFNPVTTIAYSLPERSHVTIEIYNLLGRKVRTLVDTEQSAGSHTVTWNGTSESGQTVGTGVYLYRFRAGNYTQTKKMLLLK